MLVTLLAIRVLLLGTPFLWSFRRGPRSPVRIVGHAALTLFILLVFNTSRLD